MDSETYHSRREISKHGLDLISRAPALFKYRQDNPQEQTPAMRFGEIIHTAVLEPDRFAAEYVASPKFDRRTKDGKAAYEEFVARAGSKRVITQEEWDSAQAITNKVRTFQPAIPFLDPAGTFEASLFWKQGTVDAKARIDIITDMGIVVDLKTCSSAEARAFQRDAMNFRYHVQAAWYLNACQQVGIEADSFLFICVEKEPPYLCSVFAMDKAFIDLGQRAYEADLAKYLECMESGVWPEYSNEIQLVSPPAWA
jgi:exodeoxyribonuclease VIII